MREKIFILWITLFPFVSWQGTFEKPKVVWLLAGGFSLSLFFIYRFITEKKIIRLKVSDYFFLGWILILTISSILGVHPTESIIGGSFRRQGVLFFVAIWIVGKIVTVLSKESKKLLENGLRAGVIIESAILIMMALKLGGVVRLAGTLGEPNNLAGYLVLSSFFVFPNFFILALIFVAILFTKSLTGLVAFLTFVLIVYGAKKLALKWIVLVVIGLIAGGILFLHRGQSFNDRATIWEFGIRSVAEKPILGYGAESGELVYDFAYSRWWGRLGEFAIDRAHNLFLDVAIWSGFVGLSFFLSWLITEISVLIKRKEQLKLSAIGAWVLFAMFQPVGVVHWVLLMVILRI